MYIKIIPMTEDQFGKVFVKKIGDQKSIKFRDDCYQFLSKCESTYADMKPCNKEEYRKLVSGKEFEN